MTTKEQRDELRKAAEAATPGPWSVWAEPTPTKAAVIAELTEQVMLTEDPVQHTYLLNANGKCPALTGCGPKSEANAAFIALANPQTILALLDQLDSQQPASVDASVAVCSYCEGLGHTKHNDMVSGVCVGVVIIDCPYCNPTGLPQHPAPVQQAEPMNYPSDDVIMKILRQTGLGERGKLTFPKWKDGIDIDEPVLALCNFSNKLIDWYRSQHPAPVQQAEAVAADVHRLVAGAAYDLMGYLTSRKESITLSGSELATPAVDALAKWAETVGLSLRDPDIEHWRDKLHPAPTPADEKPVGDDPVTDYIIGLRRQIYMAENTILELQKRLDTHRPAAPDLLALVDELEEVALQKHAPNCWKHMLEGRECSCDARKQHTKVLELAARLRAALGNTENSR